MRGSVHLKHTYSLSILNNPFTFSHLFNDVSSSQCTELNDRTVGDAGSGYCLHNAETENKQQTGQNNTQL